VVRRLVVLAVVVLSAMLPAGCAKPSAPPSAVYLAPRTGAVLGTEDIKAHPQVVVSFSGKQLEGLVTSSTAIWIDINATSSVDMAWLQHRADAHIPVALIGNGDRHWFGFQLPVTHLSTRTWFLPPTGTSLGSPPGFSVWRFEQASPDYEVVDGYLRGFEGTPTVSAVLAVTNALLAGRQP